MRRAINWLYCAPKSRMKTVRGDGELGGSGGRLQGLVVIRLLRDLRNDLDVFDALVFADHHDRAGQQRELARYKP